jgi:CBS domain-containing protein
MAKDPYKQRVKDVVSKDVVAVDSDDTIADVLTLMMENRVSVLPVVDRRQRCVGILSTTDLVGLNHELHEELYDLGRAGEVSRQWLIEKLAEHSLGRRKAKDLMTTTVVAVGPETPLAQAAREMLRHRVHRLPVVGGQRRLLGIISMTDILAAFVEGAPQ